MNKSTFFAVILGVCLLPCVSFAQPDGPDWEYCSTCSECESDIENNAFVRLDSNISVDGDFTCITIDNLSYKHFDCDGHEIFADEDISGYSGIEIVDSDHIFVENCKLRSWGSDETFLYSDAGIYLDQSSDCTIHNNRIDDTAQEDSANGIIVNGSSSTGNVIRRNTISTKWIGIGIVNGADNNEISGNSVTGTNWIGFEFRAVDDNLVNNYFDGISTYYTAIQGCKYRGILFNYSSDYNEVYDAFSCNTTYKTCVDIYDATGLGNHNTGDDNTCDTTYYWIDDGESGCTYACP